MKKIILIVVLLGTIAFVNGQAKSSYTQYILNNYVLNPALAGIENYTDIKVSSRNQWTGIAGAPVTTYFSYQAPIGKSDYRTNATSYAVPGQNPRGKEYWRDYTAPDPHHGIGFVAMSDKAGYIQRWSLSASYAYHKPLGLKTTLSAGFNAGVSGINLDRTKATFADDGITDMALGLSISDTRKIKPEVGAGLWVYSAR